MVGNINPHPEWRIIAQQLSTRAYGDVVTHSEIGAMSGLTHPSHRYFAQVGKARRALLREWDRELESVPGVGYRLVMPSEFIDRSRRELGFAGRRLRLGAQILVAAPQSLLTDAENARNANALAKIGAIESHRRNVMKDTRAAMPMKRDVPKMLS